MVAGVFRPEAPQHCAAITIEVNWLITFGVVTATTGTYRFTTAIIVRH